ncbi:hypothetical protein ACFQY7_01920 [Actinomadura luteofluorescens]
MNLTKNGNGNGGAGGVRSARDRLSLDPLRDWWAAAPGAVRWGSTCC